MPPKKAAAVKESNVYLITHHKISDTDEIGHMEIFQAHATLADANEHAEAKAKSLCASMEVDAPEITKTDFTKDGNFHIKIKLPKGSLTVEVTTVPLMGGTITVARKPAASKAAAKKPAPKKKAKSPSDVEEDDEDEDLDDEHEEPAKPAAINGKKRKASTPPDEDDDEEDEDASEHDIHAAPSGAANCLEGESFLVTGTLEDWTRDQIHALIKTFGGKTEKTLKASLSYVVVGTKPGQKKLDEIASKNIKTISQTGLYQHIRNSPGGETISSEDVAKTCKRAKGRTTAAANAAKVAKLTK